VLREAKVYGVLSGVAVLLGCLGLVGLSASATDRRTKEIGIRKAMGAETKHVVRLMVWQLAQPVLWASALAIPISAYLASRWLEGFAFHIPLTPWPFIGSAAIALAIAVMTVSIHCYSVARAKPVSALRYE
jgi:putative ABC transport system permease protein